MIPLLQQGMLCPCKRRVLLLLALSWHVATCLCTLGAPSFSTRLHHHWSLPLMQADAALPMGFHAAGDSQLVWRQWMVVFGIPKQRNFRCLSGKRIVLTNSRA